MIPDIKKAQQILEDSYLMNPGPWRNHSVVTAFCARQIADACGLNGERAYVSGLLHDIGRRNACSGVSHVIRGYDILLKAGYGEIARICLTHSFQIKRMTDYIGKTDVSADDMERITEFIRSCTYDDYDLLIQLCDSMCLPDGPVSPEIRMNDVKSRYGVYPQDKWDRNLELLQYFESKSGRRILDIVQPDVIMMCGISGSGKTTYARRKEKEGYVRLSLDEDMWDRYGAFGTDYPASKYASLVHGIKEEQKEKLEQLLAGGRRVILDYCFCSCKDRALYRNTIAACRRSSLTVYMKCSLEELQKRIHNRNKHIDKNSAFISDELLGQYYHGFEEPELEGELRI